MKLFRYSQFISENRIYTKKWTKEKCHKEALKYKSRIEFKKGNNNAYSASIRNGWLDEICKHMGENKIKNNYWTKERCAEEALKYKTKSEFEKGSPSAYVKSGKMGWKDEICKHMKTNGNKYNRCIYAVEFPDNHVYIGLSYNYEKRLFQHLNDIKNNSIILRHHVKTGLEPIVIQLTDYINVEDAVKLESIKLDEYKNNGWIILNKAKCGNVGGKTVKWTKEKCKREAYLYNNRNEFKKESPGAYYAALRNKWIDEICTHMNSVLKKWDYDSCKKESEKFKNQDDFKKNSSGAYGYAYRNNLLNNFFPMKYNRISENKDNVDYNLPTYEDCVKICSIENSPFYESKLIVDGYNISLFNYRLASYSDFKSKPFAKEMRGLCFVFNKDGSIYNRYLLLEKFFNLNQVPDSMYSIVKDYKIKYINNKEDGSIASFVKLPNGKILGKSKMGFDNDQSYGINRVYKTNPDVKRLVDWTLDNDIVAIFEYVSVSNRIVLRYGTEELILLRLRDNKTGKHIDIKEHLDKIGSIKIAPFEDDKTLDDLIELSKTEADKEGWIVQFDNDHMVKIKTRWYIDRHGLLTDDLYRENVIIGYILDDKIDDILGQVPEDEKEAHERINKIISIVKKELDKKESEINKAYQEFLRSGMTRKDYAINNRKGNEYFPYVMGLVKADELRKMSKEDILKVYDNYSDYEKTLSNLEPYELAKNWLREKTRRLQMARDWLSSRDPSLFFKDSEESEDGN
jgi:T4 RnlA family RNA ligase